MRLQGAIATSIPEAFRYLSEETAVRTVTRARLPVLVLVMSGLLPLVFLLPAHAGEDGYRLLELDGYKVKWGDRRLGATASVSYAFATENLRFDDAFNCRDLAPIEALVDENLSMESLARETVAAFRVWERAAALSFHEVSDARDADIVLGVQGQPRGRAFTNVSYASGSEEGVRAIEQSLVCLNPDHEWKVGFDGDEDVYDIRYTLIHEIGHAIGLDHPGPSGQVMAFRYTEAFDDLQAGDLRGVRLLYGPATGDFDNHLAEKPTEAPANNPDGGSVISTSGRALNITD
jgi:predicted Zn-dependent protease